ncbi:hypothetical protein OG963_37840 [Streptomyces sp. NBC_01707]|uniref:hypothetical protein n=1 Tax=unclassified Streptomyces TaxID=2593676 RepID=UPI00352D2000
MSDARSVDPVVARRGTRPGSELRARRASELAAWWLIDSRHHFGRSGAGAEFAAELLGQVGKELFRSAVAPSPGRGARKLRDPGPERPADTRGSS